MCAYRLRELPYEPDTLVLFSRLQTLAGSFLLYSASGFENHRFNIFSALPVQQIRLAGNLTGQQIKTTIETMVETLGSADVALNAMPLPGWYGLLAYDLLSNHTAEASTEPRLNAGFFPVVFVADHVLKQLYCVILEGHEPLADELLDRLGKIPDVQESFTLTARFRSNMDRIGYTQRFDRVQNYLHAGDCYQVNLAQRFSAQYEGDPWNAYTRLTSVLPSPMGCFFNLGDLQCLSLSPERFLAVNEGRISTHPIKGTRPRHPEPETDRQSADNLRSSEKDRAENLMIVDLLRNDLGLSCIPGSIRVTDLFAIESYANVHHLVSHIEGQLRTGVHPLYALFAAFPGGSITGAPKKRATEIIAELEPDPRSFYCGTAFYCDISGKLDSNILIRSLVCSEGTLHCWGGGGIVVDSTADAEYQETLDKVGVILSTLETLSGI